MTTITTTQPHTHHTTAHTNKTTHTHPPHTTTHNHTHTHTQNNFRRTQGEAAGEAEDQAEGLGDKRAEGEELRQLEARNDDFQLLRRWKKDEDEFQVNLSDENTYVHG